MPSVIYSAKPVSINDIAFNQDHLLKSLGISESAADAYLLQTISEISAYCLEISTPCASLSVFSDVHFDKETGKMALDGFTFSINKMIMSALTESTEVAVFIGTCGSEVERFSKRMMDEGNLLEGYIADLSGSQIAEGIAECIHRQLRVERNDHVSNRYSPGYCKWNVSDQHHLFEIMKENNCGVRLNTSALMSPIKSVSGIIGLGDQVHFKNYTCSVCEEDHCLYRDKK